MRNIKSENDVVYTVDNNSENDTIAAALAIIARRMHKSGNPLESPKMVTDYLVLKLAEKPAEAFSVLFLDNRHRVIEYRELFQGTIDGASVYPREVVRACIETNAAAVILSHNHPSGVPEPSRADIQITKKLNDALALIDVRVLDHIVVGGANTVSFAERGLI